MHELGIANSVLEAVRTESARYPGSKPRKVGVRIGTLTAIDPEALRFCFEAIVKDSEWEPLRLEIEICPQRQRCSACGHEFLVQDYEVHCPSDCEADTTCVGGEELDLAYIEVEDHEPSAVGEKSS